MQLPEKWADRSASDQAQDNKAASAADERWWALYADPVLDRLEDEALAHNTDLRVALARVLEVHAQLDVAGASQYPEISANLDSARNAPKPTTAPRWTPATSSTCGASTAAAPRRRAPNC